MLKTDSLYGLILLFHLYFHFLLQQNFCGYTNVISILGKLLNKFMRPIVSSFKSQGICTNEEAERLIAFTNNSGPLFIIGTVGIGLFKDTNTGILLFITHILACLTVGFLFRWWKSRKKRRN